MSISATSAPLLNTSRAGYYTTSLGWLLHNFPELPILMTDHPFRKEIYPKEKNLLSIGTKKARMLVAVCVGRSVTFLTECRTSSDLASSINICFHACICQCLSETGLPRTLTSRDHGRRDVSQKTDRCRNTLLLTSGQCYCMTMA